eukprot:m.39643 g.39643  ORF g.39643 m.39643 type:complete len:270 (-) comp6879_c0_seq1:2104-2913(-)
MEVDVQDEIILSRLWKGKNAHEMESSLIIRKSGKWWRPTRDDPAILHCGVSNSKGIVYNFDTQGLCKSEAGWEDCIAYPLNIDHDLADRILDEEGEHWEKALYDETDCNCFDFAVRILNLVSFLNKLWTKTSLCETLLKTSVATAAASNHCFQLFHEGNGHFIHESNSTSNEGQCAITVAKRVYSFKTKDCPVCFDYSAWRHEFSDEYLSSFGFVKKEGAMEENNAYGCDDGTTMHSNATTPYNYDLYNPFNQARKPATSKKEAEGGWE